MRKVVFISSLLVSFFANAQDDLLNMLAEDNEPMYVSYLFKGTKVVNGQSVELPAKGVLQFNIQHRFGTLNSGLYNFYGLDNAQVRLSFDYGIKDGLAVSIGRSSYLKTVDANSKIRINRDLTLQLSPTIVHNNLVEIKDEPNDKYSLGIGGRQKLTKRISLNAEYFYQLNDKINNNVLSLGFDIETGGHIFQLHLSNSSAMIDPEFISQTTGEWLKGDIYFGFNISRVFTLHK